MNQYIQKGASQRFVTDQGPSFILRSYSSSLKVSILEGFEILTGRKKLNGFGIPSEFFKNSDQRNWQNTKIKLIAHCTRYLKAYGNEVPQKFRSETKSKQASSNGTKFQLIFSWILKNPIRSSRQSEFQFIKHMAPSITHY